MNQQVMFLQKIRYEGEGNLMISLLDIYSGDLQLEEEKVALNQRLSQYDYMAMVGACRIYPKEISNLKKIGKEIDETMVKVIDNYICDNSFGQIDVLQQTGILDDKQLTEWNNMTLKSAYDLRDKLERAVVRLGFDLNSVIAYVEEEHIKREKALAKSREVLLIMKKESRKEYDNLNIDEKTMFDTSQRYTIYSYIKYLETHQ